MGFIVDLYDLFICSAAEFLHILMSLIERLRRTVLNASSQSPGMIPSLPYLGVFVFLFPSHFAAESKMHDSQLSLENIPPSFACEEDYSKIT